MSYRFEPAQSRVGPQHDARIPADRHLGDGRAADRTAGRVVAIGTANLRPRQTELRFGSLLNRSECREEVPR